MTVVDRIRLTDWAKEHKISRQRAHALVKEGRLPDAVKLDGHNKAVYYIPRSATPTAPTLGPGGRAKK